MALQYQSISHGDLGGSGIDALSSEDAIQDGYAEDLLNVDASPQGYLSKRVGYQQIYGQLPVRVLGMQYLNPTTVEYTLDSSIDLTKIQSPLHSRPVVIAGKTSYQAKTGGGTVTVLAAPTYIFRSSISIPDGQIIYLQTSGTMPGNIDQNVRYEVKLQTGSTTDFQILSTTTGAPVTPTSGGTSGLVWYPAGDFIPDAFSSQYYPNFDADVRRVLQDTSPASSTVVISATEHGLKSPYMVIGCSQSTSLIKRDNIAFNPNGVSIEQVSLTVRVDEISGVGENQFQYIYWADRSPSPGYTYISDYKTIPTGEYTVSIEAPTHGLTSRNIQALAYRVVSDGGVIKYQQVFPNAVRIKKSGEVQVTFLNGTGSSFQLFLILSVVDPDRVLSNATKDANNQIKFAIYADNPFLFASCYQDDGDDYVQVYPDSVQFYDSNVESEIHTEITFQLTSADSKSLHVFWEPGYIISNRLRVTANTSLPAGGSFVDSRPQLTLWGFDHSNLYLNPTDTHAGWVTHLDTYRSAGNNFLVAGLGGNLFSGQELDTGTRVAYKVPTLYPSLRGRSGESVVCGPAFEGSTSATYTTRTGGAFAGSGWGDGFAEVKGLTYVVEDWDGNPVPKAGYVKIEIEIKNSSFKILPDTDGHDSVINAGTDWIEIQGAGNPIHNGTWRVLHSESDVPNQALTFYAQNLTIQGLLQADSQGQLTGTTFWNCENARCGIFSGRIVLSDLFSKVSFIPGDTILSSNLTAAEPIEVTEVTKNDTDDFAVLNLNNFYQIESFPSATTIVGRRTSNVIPLRDDTNQETTFGFVGTDNLKLSNYVRQFKIKTVNSLPTTKIEQIQFSTTPEVDGDITYYPATVTLDATNTARPAYFLAKGDRITVAGVGAYSTTYTVSNILNDTQITLVTQVASSTQITWGTGGYYPHLVGKTVYIDEEILWQDSLASNVTAQVPGRWLPIEAPEHTSDLAPTTYKRYLENSAYDEQPILRSTQVADTLFLNNGDDRTLKVDGSSLYRPGLIRWQPELFFAQATATGAQSIPVVGVSVPLFSTGGNPLWANNHFSVAEGDANAFTVGTRIRRNGDPSTIYTVTGIQTGTGSSIHTIYVDKNISGTPAADTLTSISTYSYYFRLNAVDVNQNVVASAATGSYDSTIQITTAFQNRIRLVGLPTLDIYDYERIEVQVYRTKQNGVAPYYLLTTIALPFDANQGYIDWVDTIEDAALGQVSQLDPVNTALKGQELGIGWSAPVRAKHLTSAANRLVLANLTSDPYIDLVIRNIGSTVYSTDLVGKRFLLRKSNADTALDSNMVDRIGYQFVSDVAAHTISGMFYSSSTKLVTLTFTAAHGRAIGDWIYLYSNTASSNLQTHLMGWWQVTAASVGGDSTKLQFAWIPSDGLVLPLVLTDEVNRMVHAESGTDVPILLSTDYNWQTSNGQPSSSGKGIQNLATRRWASAINATQRMVNPQVTGMSGFRPWIVANAGGEFSEGQIVLTQPMNQATPFELVLPDTYSNFAVFANGIQRSQGEQVQAREDLHPSRILVSYPNFPEIFDSPFSTVDSQSDSAVDINPADGQEITGVVPFFGSSAFGAALKDAVVVVFKTNSIYVVNLAAKAAGQNPVQKIESQGLGCMASYSIAPVRDGIMFANASGIYKLRTDLSIYYMGRYMQRQWRDRVNKDKLDLVFGHNWAFGSQYKLSLPVNASSVPDETFVYNSTREYSLEGPNTQAHREGSWVRHRGFSSIGWCNLDADSFHANTGGQVMILRRTGEASDWRDDADAIQMDVVLRAMDFGDEGIRKTVPYALVSYRNPLNQGVRTGTQVFYTTDLFDAFYEADPTVIPNRAEAQGLSDEWSQKVVTFRYSFNNKRGIRFQIRIKNELKDESVEIARVRYSVAGLSIKGVMQAAKSPALYNT